MYRCYCNGKWVIAGEHDPVIFCLDIDLITGKGRIELRLDLAYQVTEMCVACSRGRRYCNGSNGCPEIILKVEGDIGREHNLVPLVLCPAADEDLSRCFDKHLPANGGIPVYHLLDQIPFRVKEE